MTDKTDTGESAVGAIVAGGMVTSGALSDDRNAGYPLDAPTDQSVVTKVT